MPYIHLNNNVVEYEFEFKQKYLFIRGDSGRGKSTLVELVEDYVKTPESVDCLGDSNLKILTEIEVLKPGCIYFFDEFDKLLTAENAKLFNTTDSYFVIISRKRNLDFLKTGLDSLCEIVTDGSYHTIKPTYPRKDILTSIGDVIVCEDSKSGFQFLNKLVDYEIESAESKDRIRIKIIKLIKQGFKSFTVVYDRCGICFSYEKQIVYLKTIGVNIVSEIDWDSFESYILESDSYDIEVPWFPDKEQNASRLFIKHVCKTYDKSRLPDNMQLPIYWKVKDLVDLLNPAEFSDEIISECRALAPDIYKDLPKDEFIKVMQQSLIDMAENNL